MPTNHASRYAEYLRKSTDDKEKQVLSLASQRDVIDRLNRSNALTIVASIEEKMSAKKPGRPGFSQLVQLVRQGKADGIVTWSPHRLSRNSVDIGELIHLFDTGKLKEIVTDSHTYRNNPMDIFLLGFHCLQAKFENDNKAIDIRQGMRKCAELGIFPHCPPLGYLPDKGGIKGARKRDIDPETFPLIRKIWDYALLGTYSTKEIMTLANEKWGLRTKSGQKLTVSKMYHIFNNPFYYGEYEWPRKSGHWYEGTHVPMISKAEFDKVHRLMGSASRPRPRTNSMAYGGCLLHCGACGNAITGYEKIKHQKNGNVHRYEYYYCAKQKRADGCDEKPTTGATLEKQVEQLLSEIWIPQAVQDLVRKKLEALNENLFRDIYVQNNLHEQQLAELDTKLNRLIDMCASGNIDDNQFLIKKKEIETEKGKLCQVADENDITVVDKLDQAYKKFSFSEGAANSFKTGDTETKRGMVKALCTDLRVAEQKLDLTREKWIYPVQQIAKRLRLKDVVYCPVLPPLSKDKIEKLINSEKVCCLMKDVLTSFD